MALWHSLGRRCLRTEIVCLLLILFTSLILLNGCSVATQKRNLATPEEVRLLDRGSPFLKAHMLDGRVYILSNWNVDSNERIVSGTGELLSTNRDILAEGTFSFSLDSVAIFETNRVHTSGAVMAMAVITGASVALTMYCIANPKACFGSCPTFYVEDGEKLTLQAEGFSSSIAPSLEASDIDALYRAKPTGTEFDVIMKNEALETHVVRYVDLLAARRPEGGRVFVTAGETFWQATQLIQPSRCRGPEGSCIEELLTFDGIEHISRTDSTFLGAKETIELEFDSVPDGNLGLVIASRQSLLSTYLLYQALAYMGSSVSDWMAALERGDVLTRKSIGSIGQVLGGIEIIVQGTSGDWIPVTQISETGPLATDVRIVPLPDMGSGSRQIRLRFTKGHWRFDYVAIAVLAGEVTPLELQPVMVHQNSNLDSTTREILLDTSQVLVTLPGDIYTMTYRLPDDYTEYELFLKSRGYYMEWVRDEWLAEEDPARVAMMFLNPEKALRVLAPRFKEIEAEMEEQFWRSRYAR